MKRGVFVLFKLGSRDTGNFLMCFQCFFQCKLDVDRPTLCKIISREKKKQKRHESRALSHQLGLVNSLMFKK